MCRQKTNIVQIAVCLAKAPQLLKENLEEKLLPLCEYLNSIGLDLPKQRLIVTWCVSTSCGTCSASSAML